MFHREAQLFRYLLKVNIRFMFGFKYKALFVSEITLRPRLWWAMHDTTIGHSIKKKNMDTTIPMLEDHLCTTLLYSAWLTNAPLHLDNVQDLYCEFLYAMLCKLLHTCNIPLKFFYETVYIHYCLLCDFQSQSRWDSEYSLSASWDSR